MGVKEAVRNKMGLGVLYRSVVELDLRQGDFNLIRCPEVKIIYRVCSALSQYALAFLDLLRLNRHCEQADKFAPASTPGDISDAIANITGPRHLMPARKLQQPKCPKYRYLRQYRHKPTPPKTRLNAKPCH
jgi:hypothetical protein